MEPVAPILADGTVVVEANDAWQVPAVKPKVEEPIVLSGAPAAKPAAPVVEPVLAVASERKPIVMPKKALTLGLFFRQLELFTTPEEKIAWLRLNEKPVLRYLLRLGYDETIEWLLPKGLPPFKPLTFRRGPRVLEIRPGQAPTELLFEARRLYMFVKGAGADTAKQIKREKVFQQMLEDMEPVEVDVLACVKDKKLDKFASKDVVAAAYPGIFNGPFSPKFIRR